MTNETKIKIIIADDNKGFREALKFIVNKNKRWHLIGEAENGRQLIEMSELNLADIVLLDLEMPDMDGLTAAKFINWHHNQIKIIAVTMYTDKAYMYELITHGFKGCIFKAQIYDELDLAISKVISKKFHFPKEILINDKNLNPDSI